MRNAFAIFFLVIFALYNLGHILYIQLGPIQVTKQWYKKVIDENDHRLTTLEIPVNLPPYTVDHEEYRYVDGLLTIEGKPYRKVFQKIARDTLFVKVLPDHLSKSFLKSVADWVHSVNDTDDEKSQSGKETSTPPTIKEYLVGEIFSFYPIKNPPFQPEGGYFKDFERIYIQVTSPPPKA